MWKEVTWGLQRCSLEAHSLSLSHREGSGQHWGRTGSRSRSRRGRRRRRRRRKRRRRRVSGRN